MSRSSAVSRKLLTRSGAGLAAEQVIWELCIACTSVCKSVAVMRVHGGSKQCTVETICNTGSDFDSKRGSTIVQEFCNLIALGFGNAVARFLQRLDDSSGKFLEGFEARVFVFCKR